MRLLDVLEPHRFHAALLAGVPVHLLALSAALVHDSHVAHLFLAAVVVLLISRAVGVGAPALAEASNLGAGRLITARVVVMVPVGPSLLAGDGIEVRIDLCGPRLGFLVGASAM